MGSGRIDSMGNYRTCSHYTIVTISHHCNLYHDRSHVETVLTLNTIDCYNSLNCQKNMVMNDINSLACV